MSILKTARQKQNNGEVLNRLEKKAIRQSDKHKTLRAQNIRRCVEDLTAEGERCKVLAERYVITDLGRFIIATGKCWRTGSPGIKPGGYKFVGVVENGRTQYKMLHRLVAEAFVDNPNNLPEVNHKDGNKLNNAATNLEWVTRKQNAKHAAEMGLTAKGDKVASAKLNDKKVKLIRQSKLSCKKTGEQFGVCAQTVNNIKLGRTWQHVV